MKPVSQETRFTALNWTEKQPGKVPGYFLETVFTDRLRRHLRHEG